MATVQLTLEAPEDLALLLGENSSALSRAALEGLRSNKLSVAQARRLLGVPSRYAMDGFLKEHEIFLPLTIEEVKREAEIAMAHLKR